MARKTNIQTKKFERAIVFFARKHKNHKPLTTFVQLTFASINRLRATVFSFMFLRNCGQLIADLIESNPFNQKRRKAKNIVSPCLDTIIIMLVTSTYDH